MVVVDIAAFGVEVSDTDAAIVIVIATLVGFTSRWATREMDELVTAIVIEVGLLGCATSIINFR